jgi:hypothetical protein
MDLVDEPDDRGDCACSDDFIRVLKTFSVGYCASAMAGENIWMWLVEDVSVWRVRSYPSQQFEV